MSLSVSDRPRRQEPDLYFSNGERPGRVNYTVYDYVGDYYVVFNQLRNTSSGDILAQNNIGGPTICCAWVLNGPGTFGHY
jgi:hypothetical protein